MMNEGNKTLPPSRADRSFNQGSQLWKRKSAIAVKALASALRAEGAEKSPCPQLRRTLGPPVAFAWELVNASPAREIVVRQ